MTWPIDTISTVHLDASTDDPAQARAELKLALDLLKDVIAGRNTANGIAPLDGSSLVPDANLGNALLKGESLAGLGAQDTARTNLGAGAIGASIFISTNAIGVRSLIDALSTTGGVITGPISTSVDPTVVNHLARRGWIEANMAPLAHNHSNAANGGPISGANAFALTAQSWTSQSFQGDASGFESFRVTGLRLGGFTIEPSSANAGKITMTPTYPQKTASGAHEEYLVIWDGNGNAVACTVTIRWNTLTV